MRTLLTILLLTTATPVLADSCGDLIDRVAAETKAEVGHRSPDFANFSVSADTSLTLACGEPSSVGAQFRGETPPDAYYRLFGRAGQAVTGIDAATIETAAHAARDAASRLRHSNVDAGGARITCSVTNSGKGPLTLCAISEHSDRS
jgi:hypothetical protein